ncbi:DUF6503 family protein [Salisaeta longa]|uniref:DUF6503 family protein n=1 Tax=Salisaeta longa TaxID=503170 RepID=UPI0004908D65|nr:DUF6503 family protein [Salisaeta longa]
MRCVVYALVGSLLLVWAGCEPSSPPLSAAAVVDSARAAHGSARLHDAVVRFTFRDARFTLRQNDGRYRYEQTFTDTLGRRVVEGLSNDSVYRAIDGTPVRPLPDSARDAIATAVNSVRYFALLPGPLNDPAVQLGPLTRDTIRGVPYYQVPVTFRKQGGGKDHEDVFVYWFHPETFAMNYLAYAYGVGPGESFGTRFRVAYNERRVGGVRFADFRNYTDTTLAADQLGRYPERMARDALTLVSRIALDSVRVEPLP